jgi:hypothetical protein
VKKLFVILLAIIYGVSASGITLQLHYCCGKLKTVDLSLSAPKECGMEHKMGSKPCCETKLVADNSDEHYYADHTAAPVFTPAEPARPYRLSSIPAFPATASVVKTFPGSPPSSPLFILNRVFRI